MFLGMLLAVALSVDVLSMGRLTDDVSDEGWTVHAVTNYQENHQFALRFKTKDGYLQSPLYPYRIHAIEADVLASNTNPTRFLSIIPMRNGELLRDQARTFAVPSTAYEPTHQTLSFEDIPMHQFQICYTGKGSNNWGILSLTLHYKLPFVIRIH